MCRTGAVVQKKKLRFYISICTESLTVCDICVQNQYLIEEVMKKISAY